MGKREQFVMLVARLAAKQIGVPADQVDAAGPAIIGAVNAELSREYSGEMFRIEFPTCKVPPELRAERNRRILAALAHGDQVASIAQREHVSPRMVRWLRAKVPG